MLMCCYVAVASNSTNAVFMFLHGLGDTGERWSKALESIVEAHVKLVCPTAASIPVTINKGARMPAWFDIRGLDLSAAEDVHGVWNATKETHSLIDEQIAAGVPPERILIGGFSQGGALALHAGLTYPQRLAGIVALSCWLPFSTLFEPSKVVANRDVDVLQCHGNADNVVPYTFGQLSAFAMRGVTRNVDFRTFAGLGHTVSPQEMSVVADFIKSHLPAAPISQ